MRRQKQLSPGGSSSPLDGATAGGGLATTKTLASSQTSSDVSHDMPVATAVGSRGPEEAPAPGPPEGGVDGAMVAAYQQRSQREKARESLQKMSELMEWAVRNSSAVRGDAELGQDYFEYQHASLLGEVTAACDAPDPVKAWVGLFKGWESTLKALVSLRKRTESERGEEARAAEKASEDRRKREEGNRRAAEEKRAKAAAEAARKHALREAYDRQLDDLRSHVKNYPPPPGKAVSLARNAAGDQVIGISGGQAHNFKRRADGSVVYVGVNDAAKNRQIRALERALSRPSQEKNREVWDCAEVDAAVQIALSGGNFDEYSYLSIIKEESSPDYHYLQTCLNCTYTFTEPPRE
ncbi:hypothetical protein [Sorangium sp. So ce854]|uniref:hypothetical protein n=1 Tax=Sorangium sp. So ce854 TaxID=3133322 RepID=UPI003F633368